MIRTFYQDDIINRLAAIITYGIDSGYSYKSIEEHIVNSTFVNDLENNQYDIESKIETIVESTYHIKLDKEADISFRGLFFAESYFKLFIHYNRSFEYLFLYWPLSLFVEKYGVYHEMDFSNLKKDFELERQKTTLIRKLSSERGIKLTEVSKLTGINDNTIDRYSRDDHNLIGVSHENIYKLSTLFGVKQNIFISNIAVYMDQSIYLFDKSNEDYRNYLGYYFASFYDKRINELDFKYDNAKKCFTSKNNLRLVVVADSFTNESYERIKALFNSDTYVVIIPSGFFGDESYFTFLEKSNAFDVFVLTQEFIYIFKRKVKREITDTINRSLIIRAKESSHN